jgi:hypothetical protein
MKKGLLFVLLIVTKGYTQSTILWQNALGGVNYDYGNFIFQTNDGGYINAGKTNSSFLNYHQLWDGWLSKLDQDGNVIWQRCYGSNGDDVISNIMELNGGYLFVGDGGHNSGDVSGNHSNDGHPDVWAVKIDLNGNVLWQKCYGGTRSDYGISIKRITDGELMIAGNSLSNDGDVSGHHGPNSQDDFWILKLDSSFNILWQKSLGGTGRDALTSFELTLDGGCIAAGVTDSNDGDVTGLHGAQDGWVVKLDNFGNIQWQKTYGGSYTDYVASLKVLSDGTYIFVGGTASNDGDVSGNHGGNDYWLVKLNATGNILWSKTYGGNYSDNPSALEQFYDGGYIISGQTSSRDSNITGSHDTLNNLNDYWIVKTDSIGNLEWEHCYGGTNDDRAIHLIVDNDTNYVITGNAISNDGDITNHHGGNTTDDSWVLKLTGESVGINERNKKSFNIYPNPTTSTFTISLNDQSSINNNQLQISDLTGRVVHQQTLTQKSEVIYQNFSPGVYFVRVSDGEKSFTEKLVIE